MSGLLRVRSSSSSLRTGGRRCTTNESAPTSVTMAVDTIAFMPWMSDTMVTIEVTATMLPSTVMNDRSLLAQMACSAIADGVEDLVHVSDRPCPLSGSSASCRSATASLLPAHFLAVGQLAHRGERPGDHVVARLEAVEHLEILLPGHADLDGREHRAALPEHEHAFGLLARVSRRRLVGDRAGRFLGGSAAARRLFVHERAGLVEEHLADGQRLNRHRDRLLARSGGDLRRAGEAGTDVRHLLVERDHHLEGRRLPLAGVAAPVAA